MAHMQVLHGNVLSLAVRKFTLHAILGFLQVQFLSSAIGISIQQHVEFHYDDMYRLRLTPVCGVKHTTIHIMWVKFSPSSNTLDHICPLVPMDSASCNEILYKKLINISFCLPVSHYLVLSANMQSHEKPLAFIDETCVMRASKQCVVEHLHGKEFINWIQCTSCHSWYHDACVGLSTDTLPTTFVFSCCSAHQHNSSMLVNNAMFIVLMPSCCD